METETSHNLPSARWRPRKTGGIIPVQIQRSENQGNQQYKSHGGATNFFGLNSFILPQNSETEMNNPGKIHTTQMCKVLNAPWGNLDQWGQEPIFPAPKWIQHSFSKYPYEAGTLFPTTNIFRIHLCIGFPSFPVLLSSITWDYRSSTSSQYFYSRLGVNPYFPGRIQANTTTLVFCTFKVQK